MAEPKWLLFLWPYQGYTELLPCALTYSQATHAIMLSNHEQPPTAVSRRYILNHPWTWQPAVGLFTIFTRDKLQGESSDTASMESSHGLPGRGRGRGRRGQQRGNTAPGAWQLCHAGPLRFWKSRSNG
ncbi:predicted protein [Histoplasma capsulatum G186AR]|uniref:Uncharacterized protein n=1 Tax=Ajellomyces capsulatus (strain G186AR / H82 / ATCC MYA-2454 / RMSCC 2432) TaxID=447093 RepID=C0NLZ6_AJECG|nr:uncharacterized protein HCBG_04526 [Histoplasma capsulatum G186AR]EEH07647.1 predicted protein [Histoplasma capsulatum G186AR]